MVYYECTNMNLSESRGTCSHIYCQKVRLKRKVFDNLKKFVEKNKIKRGADLAKNTVSQVWEIAEPIAEELGLILWDVCFEKEGANYYLRIFIDKEDGVGIEDCVNMSHAMDTPLDEADLIDRQYNLQVSSPGIERKLTRDFHFDYFMGEKVILRLIRPFEGQREFKGVLIDYSEEGAVTIEFDEENTMTAEKKEIAWVKLDDFSF